MAFTVPVDMVAVITQAAAVEAEAGGACKSLAIMLWWPSIRRLGFSFIFKVLIHLGSFLRRVNGTCEPLCPNPIVSFLSDTA